MPIGGETTFHDQLARALAAGNLIITDATHIGGIEEALKSNGADVIRAVDLSGGVSQDLLLDEAL